MSIYFSLDNDHSQAQYGSTTAEVTTALCINAVWSGIFVYTISLENS